MHGAKAGGNCVGADRGGCRHRIDVGNDAPVPTILSPVVGAQFAVNDNIVLQGSATDAQDGALPDAAPELVSYTVYRWECAIRGSVIMGFVGAGGLGQRMEESMKMLAGGEVCTMLLVFVALVAAADLVSKWLRGRLA